MSREKQIEEKHELSESIYMSGHGLDWKDSDDIAEQLYQEGYRKQSEGHWEFRRPNCSYYCSHCGKGIKIKYGERAANLWDFCPNCGAKMKGV